MENLTGFISLIAIGFIFFLIVKIQYSFRKLKWRLLLGKDSKKEARALAMYETVNGIFKDDSTFKSDGVFKDLP